MNETVIERTAGALAHILSLLGGSEYSKTKLVKLLYLLDYKTFKGEGKTFTGLKYKKYYYGPYSEDIEKAISMLKRRKILKVEDTVSVYGYRYYIFQLEKNASMLPEADQEKIENALGNYLHKELDEILDIVYDTEPMKGVSFGQEIQFAGSRK